MYNASDIARNFRDKLVVENVAPWLKVPKVGELYWIDSRYTPSKGQRYISLLRHNGTEQDTTIVRVNIPASGLCRVRVKCRYSHFINECSITDRRILGAQHCVDPTLFGVEINDCDMEKSSICAEVCTKLINRNLL